MYPLVGPQLSLNLLDGSTRADGIMQDLRKVPATLHAQLFVLTPPVLAHMPSVPACPDLQLSLNLLDDPVLASAFAVSLRTSFNQVPHAVSDPVGKCITTAGLLGRDFCLFTTTAPTRTCWALSLWNDVSEADRI